MHELIDLQVSDFLVVAVEQLSGRSKQWRPPKSVTSGCDCGIRPKLTSRTIELESFLFEAVYRHPRLIPVRDAATSRLRDLFDVLLLNHPNRLPLRFRKRSETVPVKKVIGEYLAGMTDSFCDAQWEAAGKSETGPLGDW